MKGVEGVQISYLGGGVPLPPYPPKKPLKIEKILNFLIFYENYG